MASRRALLFVFAVAALALAGAGTVRADGDPASDYLGLRHIFFPFDARTSSGAQKALTTAVSEANKAGYPIRVAVIEKPSDLGVVTSLWGKPTSYARFLDLELSGIFKGPLLVTMPAGLGFAHNERLSGPRFSHVGKPSRRERSMLASVPIEDGPDGPALTAVRAVERLSAQAGHPIAAPALPPATTSGGSSMPWLEIAGVALVIVLATAAAVFAVARSRRSRRMST